MPLVDKFTVPDDMPVRFFSSRSIKISHQQCPALVMPVSLIDQLLEIIEIALEPKFQAVHVSVHDVEPAKPRNFKVAHGDPPRGEITGILVPGHPSRIAWLEIYRGRAEAAIEARAIRNAMLDSEKP